MYNVYLLTRLLHLEPPAGAVVVVGVAVVLQGGGVLYCTVLHCTVPAGWGCTARWSRSTRTRGDTCTQKIVKHLLIYSLLIYLLSTLLSRAYLGGGVRVQSAHLSILDSYIKH